MSDAAEADVPGRTEAEIASQPDCWRRAARCAPRSAGLLPAPGERVAVVGCGTSWFIAQSYAVPREAAGLGETDAFAASEMPPAAGTTGCWRCPGRARRPRSCGCSTR